jgi:hypothetical protein
MHQLSKRKVQMKKILSMFAALLLVLVPASQATTVNSAVQTVALTMTIPESLTVSASPATINFTFNAGPGTATASGPVSVVTTWNLATGHTSLQVWSYFTSANALNGTATPLGTGSFFQAVNAGAAGACSVTGPFSTGNSCPQIANVATPGQTGTRTDSLVWSLTGIGAAVPGSYTGTINIAAQAI